jgi:hypothetical protein
MKLFSRNTLTTAIQRATTASLIGLTIGMFAGSAVAAPPVLDSSNAANAAAEASQPSPAQMKALDNRLAVVNEVWQAANRAPAIAALSDAEKRSRLITLYNTPTDALSPLVGKGFNSAAEFDQAVSLASTQAAGGVRGIAKSLGSANQDWTFRAFTPCRLYDSRFSGPQASSAFGSGTILPPNVWHSVRTDAAGRGSAVGCNVYTLAGVDTNVNIAFGAVAVALGTVNATTPLTATMRPWNGSSGGPSSVIVAAPTTASATSSAIVQVDQRGEDTLQLQIFNTTGSAHATVDVFGAFVITPATPLQCQFTTTNSTALPAIGSTGAAFPPACPTGYSQVSTFCRGSTYDVSLTVAGTDACAAKNFGSAAATIEASNWCCRTPGR